MAAMSSEKHKYWIMMKRDGGREGRRERGKEEAKERGRKVEGEREGRGGEVASQLGSHIFHYLLDKLSLEHHQKTQLVHIPRRGSIVLHEVECSSHMRMTVITKEVMLEEEEEEEKEEEGKRRNKKNQVKLKNNAKLRKKQDKEVAGGGGGREGGRRRRKRTLPFYVSTPLRLDIWHYPMLYSLLWRGSAASTFSKELSD